MATSTAFSRNVPISSILDDATWSSSTVFTSFYLRDRWVRWLLRVQWSNAFSWLVVVRLSDFSFQLGAWAMRTLASLHVFASSVVPR